MNKKRRAFTLIELVVVIAIIGILSAVLIPGYNYFIEKAYLSNDEQLVKNVNTYLKGKEILEGTPNDATYLQHQIENDMNITLETKSKGNYLWYNPALNMVVLSKLDENGLVYEQQNKVNTVRRADVTSSTGTYLSSISCPEKFVEGYWFISTKSKDGFAQSISSIRNAGSLGIDSLEKNITTLQSKNSTVGSLLNTLSDQVAFLGTKEELVIRDGKNPMMVLCSSDVKTIDQQLVNMPETLSISVIDIPSTVTHISESSKSVIAEKQIVAVVVESSLKEDLMNTEGITVLDATNRKTSIGAIVFTSEYGIAPLAKEVYVLEGMPYQVNFPVVYYGSTTATGAKTFAGWLPQNKDDEEDNYISGGSSYDYVVKEEDFNQNVFEYTAKFHNVEASAIMNSLYYDIHDAIDSSSSGDKIIVFSQEAKIQRDITLNRGVELVIPYNGNDTIGVGQKNENAIFDNRIFYDIDNGLHQYSKLSVEENVVFTIHGTITVGGNLGVYQGGTTSYLYSTVSGEGYGTFLVNKNAKVILDDDSSILNIYGIVDGDGEIIANAGKVTELVVIEDWYGGTNTAGTVQNGVFPFNNWHLDSNRVKTTFYFGSKLDGYTVVRVSETIQKVAITFLGEDSCLFVFDGENSIFTKTYQKETKKITFNLKGNFHDSKVVLDVAGHESDLSTMAFPLTSLDVILEGANLELSKNMYKFLPSSSLIVDEKSMLNISTTLAAYETFVRSYKGVSSGPNSKLKQDYPNPTSKFTNYPYSLIVSTSKILNNGVISVSSSGKVSGLIESNVESAKLIIDSDASLTTQIKEGTGYMSGTSFKLDQCDTITRSLYIYTNDIENGYTKSLISRDSSASAVKDESNLLYDQNYDKVEAITTNITFVSFKLGNQYVFEISE